LAACRPFADGRSSTLSSRPIFSEADVHRIKSLSFTEANCPVIKATTARVADSAQQSIIESRRPRETVAIAGS
jgi:hypothetical protein